MEINRAISVPDDSPSFYDNFHGICDNRNFKTPHLANKEEDSEYSIYISADTHSHNVKR